MSHSSAPSVQSNPSVQPKPVVQLNPAVQPQAEIRPINTLVNLLEKLHDNVEGVKLVLSIYCNCINDIVDPVNKTNLLMWAIEKKYDVCFNEIIKTNINKEHINIKGDNAVTYAAKFKRFNYSMILLVNKFSVNHANYHKDTVLSLAIKKRFITAALEFINRGADVKLLNANVVKFFDNELSAIADERVDAHQETEENKARRTTNLINLLKFKSLLIKLQKID